MIFIKRSLPAEFLVVLLTVSLFASGDCFALQGQSTDDRMRNSTRKIRVKPSATAAKIGTGVQWLESLDEARKKSAELGRPIFWYVPTVQGTFMDRKKSIDRYMMAGPFSWPAVIQYLNDHFVCVKQVASGQDQKKYELIRYKFVEPGFLIVQPDGVVSRRVDEITTLHPDWFMAVIGGEVKPADDPAAVKLFQAGKYAEAKKAMPELRQKKAPQQEMVSDFFEAMIDFRLGDHESAKIRWQKIAKEHSDHPLGWKAAAEAEGFGPFVRGFEVYRSVPSKALTAGVESKGTASPNNVYSEAEVWERSVSFLLGMQRSDGAWVDCDYDFGGTDSLPNVHVAVTSLSAMALLEAREKFPQQVDRLNASIAKAAKFVTTESNLNRADRDELFWALAYRCRLLARMVGEFPEWRPALESATRDLENLQGRRGSWYHEYNNPFVTGSALCALHEAQQAGVQTNSDKVSKGIKSLSSDRFANGAYPYSSGRGGGESRPGTERQISASAGRMPLCELALNYWDNKNQEDLVNAIEKSFAGHELLEVAFKYDDHTSNLSYGGFFFWYDMRGRSEAIANVADETLQKKFREQQRGIVMSKPELDGCFVDSHELGRVYGTAMALLCLGQ